MTKYRSRNRIEQDYAKGYKHCSCEHTSMWHKMDKWANNTGECEKCMCPKYNEMSLKEALNDHTTLNDMADEVLKGHEILREFNKPSILPKGFGDGGGLPSAFTTKANDSRTKQKKWLKKILEVLKK